MEEIVICYFGAGLVALALSWVYYGEVAWEISQEMVGQYFSTLPNRDFLGSSLQLYCDKKF